MKITIKEINDLVWGGNWKGAIDDLALRERLNNLLNYEKQLLKMLEELKQVKRFLGVIR